MISINDISEQAKNKIDIWNISLKNSQFENLPDIFLFLVLKFNFKDVWKKYIELYPCESGKKSLNEKNYDELISVCNLILTNPDKYKISDVEIHVKMLENPPYQSQSEKEKNEFPAPYFETYGGYKEEKVELDLYSRMEWLLLKISRGNCIEKYICYNDIDKHIVHMSDIDILCHCLYEMTFMGYSDSEVKEQKEFSEG